MAFQPVPDTCRVSMEYLSGTRHIVNTFHFHYEGSVDVTAMEALGGMMESWEEEFNHLSRWNGSTWQRCTVLNLNSSISPVVEIIPATPIAGSQAAEPIANNVAVVTSLKTGGRGRSYRGRIYWGMLTELTVTADGVSPSAQDAYDNQVEALKLGGDAIDWTLSVCSRVHDGIVLPLGETYPVTDWQTRPFVKSQRRRLAK